MREIGTIKVCLHIQSNLCTTTTLGTQKQWPLLTGGRCSEVCLCYKRSNKDLIIMAVVNRWSLAQVWLYIEFVRIDLGWLWSRGYVPEKWQNLVAFTFLTKFITSNIPQNNPSNARWEKERHKLRVYACTWVRVCVCQSERGPNTSCITNSFVSHWMEVSFDPMPLMFQFNKNEIRTSKKIHFPKVDLSF